MRVGIVFGATALVLAAALVSCAVISANAMGATARTSPTTLTGSTAAIKWGNPVFTDNFSGKKLGRSWDVYNSPNVKAPKPKRTVSSVRVRDGMLQLIGHYQKPYGYVGGGVADKQDRTYGRWEIRFRADAGAGYGAVVLLWPKLKWPDHGEIDLAEVTNQHRLGAGEFLHMGKANNFIGKQIPASVNFTQWHTIAVDWLPDHITFWLDGKVLWTVKRPSGTAIDYVPTTPFHLALQNDEGCDYGCKPNKHTPARVIMDVDWVKVYAPPRSAAARPAVTATAYSPNGSYLATADSRGHLYLWSLPGYKLKETITDPDSKGVDALAFTSQGHYVAAADGNGHVFLWTLASGKLNATVTDPGSKGVHGVAFTSDGKTMSTADANGHIYIWAEPDYKLVATLTNP